MEKLEIGVYDDPKNQKQEMFELDLLSSNIVVFGKSMSGKTTFIKTLLVRMHEKYTPQTENVYIVDFSGALLKYKSFKFVCGCFDNSNEENIKRLFNRLESIISKNTKILGGVPFREYVKADKPAHITFIIENFNGFLADKRYDAYHEKLMKLCREGLSKGITIVLTAADTSGGVNSYISNFGQKIAFEMPGDKLTEIFGSKVMVPMSLPGRGLTVISNLVYEFQCFMPFKVENPSKYNDEKEFEVFREKTDHRFVGANVDIIGSFDGELTVGNFSKYSSKSQSLNEANADAKKLKGIMNPVTVGLDYYDMNPVTIDLSKTPSIAIYGKKQSGKSNLLWLIVEALANMKATNEIRFVLLDDGRKQLEGIADYLNEKQIETENIIRISELDGYLYNEGYFDTAFGDAPFVAKDNPFTVFVFQSRATYTGKEGMRWIEHTYPEMVSDAKNKWMFIFSDTQNINDNYVKDSFNDNLSLAILLRDIAEYVNDKGTKTVFGGMDAKELKEQYARIEQGDGYFYDIDSDDLVKLKFIYADELKKRESKEVSREA